MKLKIKYAFIKKKIKTPKNFKLLIFKNKFILSFKSKFFYLFSKQISKLINPKP